jgi:hypothetical protein
MATWDELHSYIRVTYKVAEDTGTFMKLLFNVGGGRSQVVFVGRNDTGGGDSYATISSPFGTVGKLDLAAVLSELGEYVVGGAAVYGDLVVLRHSIPLDNLDPNEFEGPLHLVLNTADILEEKFVGGDDY